MSQVLSRQQIYDRIRSSSKDSYILEEMKRLGFWANEEVPSLTEAIIQREATLQNELNEFLAKDRKYSNQEAMLREMRQKRMKEAKEKRVQTKEKNEKKVVEKANAWAKSKKKQIVYLGEEVSRGLSQTESNLELLQKNGLPVFEDVLDLATKIGIDLATLRNLTFHRKVSTHSHYHTFEVAKKSGGKRKISAPKKKLKMLQTWILENVLNPIAINEHAHGFVKQKSIVTNAQPHLGKDIVINLDLKDFFPTITFKRVKGLFCKLGYSEQLATIFALACTQAATEEVEMDGVNYFVQKNERFLPQGSPASPAISNIIVYSLDKRIVGLCQKLGFTYTRYADDLSFSTSKEYEKNIAQLLFFVGKVIESEDFMIHPDKTHVMRAGAQQKVTGIVVNEKLNVENQKLKKFRALLHNIEMNGWKDQKWGKAVHLINAIEGYIDFVHMVNPARAKQFKDKLAIVTQKHGSPVVVPKLIEPIIQPKIEKVEEAEQNPPTETKPETPADWWKLF